jgi:6,7-dimethyl-8-ribityllumazine synthase
MATNLKNLSDYNPEEIPSGEGKRIGIVVSEWNREITHALLEGTVNTLHKYGVSQDDTWIEHVPGSFELPLGAQLLMENRKPDAIICLGCVIQGETRHFDFICQGVTMGITELNLKYGRPFIFGVLTTDTIEQARDRAGGKYGNKGDEAAVTALRMVHFPNPA